MNTSRKWYTRETSFVREEDYHYYDDILEKQQANPHEMIRIIPSEHHSYRTFLTKILQI